MLKANAVIGRRFREDEDVTLPLWAGHVQAVIRCLFQTRFRLWNCCRFFAEAASESHLEVAVVNAPRGSLGDAWTVTPPPLIDPICR